jgi:hypothetical protein
VIVEVRQQRGARSAHRGMNIAVDPRRRHQRSLRHLLGGWTCRMTNVLPPAKGRKGYRGCETP